MMRFRTGIVCFQRFGVVLWSCLRENGSHNAKFAPAVAADI